MTLAVREDSSMFITEEMAERMGLHPGSPIHGGYTLRPGQTREEAARRFHGMPAHTFKLGESAVPDLIRGGEEEAIADLRHTATSRIATVDCLIAATVAQHRRQ